MSLGKLKSRIKSVISRLGRPLAYRTVAKAGSFYDPTLATVDTNITGVVFDFRSDEIDGSIVLKKDKQIVVSADGLTIKKGDSIVDNGVEYKIIDFEEVQPGTEKAMYIVQGRA